MTVTVAVTTTTTTLTLSALPSLRWDLGPTVSDALSPTILFTQNEECSSGYLLVQYL
jgi:hypothetical protein